MARDTIDDFDELWKDSDRNWHDLRRRLQKQRGKADNIDDTSVKKMIKVSQGMEQSGQDFPRSSKELAKTLKKQSKKIRR